MDVARPYSAVVPSLEGDVLVTLAGTRKPMTGREVARLVKTGSQAGVLRALRRLAEQGLVEANDAGRATDRQSAATDASKRRRQARQTR